MAAIFAVTTGTGRRCIPTFRSATSIARSPKLAAGAVQEGETLDLPYGRQAMFADPFGNGFCLIEFNAQGYDALLA